MSDVLLVLNAGSSSIKFALYEAHTEPTADHLICEGGIGSLGHRPHFKVVNSDGSTRYDTYLPEGTSHDDAMAVLIGWIETTFPEHRLSAVGHRVVHGGALFDGPVDVTPEVIAQLRAFDRLAPLHQPHNVSAIEALAKLHPSLTQIACFDTAFHHRLPEVATAFALPRELTEQGVRRYGFHGLSYEYIAGRLPDVAGQAVADGRVVVAHLGAGASMCAMLRCRSIATTMGFTALDGLMMGSRCGELDPGVVLYLLEEKSMTPREIEDLLYRESGLLGVSGISDDMRTLLASDDPHACEAIELFVYRIARELGSLAAALGGLDALVFTGGIGEHASEIRRRVCEQAAWLGVTLDPDANASLSGAGRISAPDSKVSAWAIPTDEDLMIARHVWRLADGGR
ncbi:acetate/propionate family kinase [Rhodopseudomonas palustris]|uniref:acetate/propionate family kinase n=1 Tax=Rhodopseudomonas palustris TaxID=1076 RepID=UPI000E5A6B16|nr:acetate/propionate family kinase [Rhodopseudomonas palustris]QLH73502.1 acetate/propionate family kinase [Rhodopseudomonas palustris]RIA02910.1 acetate/propionate family kinase [Rhodopseudomonas palustris]